MSFQNRLILPRKYDDIENPDETNVPQSKQRHMTGNNTLEYDEIESVPLRGQPKDEASTFDRNDLYSLQKEIVDGGL